MKLELKEIGSASRRNWTLERGRRTLGRAGDCDWQVEDPTCSVSKLHCIIERDRAGFQLRDESANGTRVDGKNVLEGETARLDDGTRIEMGGRVFSVSISGMPDPDIEDPPADLQLSDEPITISAILADVAPGGRSAGGILAGREAGELPVARGKEPSSRNVDIGWDGPPKPVSGSSILPENWNEDAGTDYGNQLEHGSATHLSVPVSPIRPVQEEARPAPPVPDPDILPDPVAPPRAMFTEDAQLKALLREIEAALRDLYGIFEIDPSHGEANDKAPLAHGGSEVAVGLASVLERQLRFNAAFQGLLSDLSQAIEPRIVETRVDSAPRRLPWRSDRSYWQAYVANFREGGTEVALRDLMKTIMLRRFGHSGDGQPGGSGKANEDE